MYSFNVEMNHSPKLSPSTSDSSIGSPSSPAASPRRVNGSSDKTMTMAELQQENARLRKELEAKETKLNSSMRSIKMFWSPELKKERAARKAEEEKHARLREQFSVVSKESQQRTATIQDLEEQLKKHHEEVGRSSPFSSSASVHSQDGVQREIEILRLDKDRQDNETFILQRSLEELSARLEAQQQAMQAKDETITQLMGMIQSNKGVESKQMEMLKDHQSSDRKKLTEALNQLAKLREVIDERDRAIASLKEEINHVKINNVSDELKQSADLLSKDSQIVELETQITQLEAQMVELKKVASADETRRKEDKKQAEVYESHSKFMKSKIESLKIDLGKKDAALTAAETKLETLQAHQSNQQEHISILQTSLSAKEQRIKNLQGDLESLRIRLDEREDLLKQKEKKLISVSSEHSENSYAVDNLQSLLVTKERQITSLRLKCESLEKDLHEKDLSVLSVKSQLSSLKAEHAGSFDTISNLEATVRDKDKHIEMLQDQRQRNGAESEEELTRVKRSHDKLEARVTSLREQLSEKEVETTGLEERISSLQKSLHDKASKLTASQEKIKELVVQLKEKGSTDDQVTSELKCKNVEITKLEKDLRKQQTDLRSKEKEVKILQDEVKEQNWKIQQLTDDCEVKDHKIEDMEKQLREQSKKLVGVKRNQQLEREKQAQLLNEVKKQEDQKGETTEFYQNELQKKDERIAVLEEALTESVSIAAEREELLAQQAQNAETATHRVEEMEIEVERVRIETAVTNTKNASLVLALNENDIILSYYKSERHNMVEQLLEMRQNALLATISEKDANIALLELSPTVGSDDEVKKFKAEKDKLVNELKEQTQKRMTLLSKEDSKEISLSSELSQASTEKVLEAVSLIEDSMDKLQQYVQELLDNCDKHFPDLKRRVPKITRREEVTDTERLKNASQGELLSLLHTLENDMQILQDNVHKLLETVEDFSDT
ncbi:LOW QUALITY PROTEIN: ELKS/Rab6-interacting/CAST family member 1-like [Acropora millepora]|uniref:LOW QUALITY PROTEIN: ELKS/Rab6-interacting/CAST family member 1-like n=1 Tax=Acropora millepora TaxID=45264 RepID=UPI001CF5AB7F|nr:LOW QUALITY PROTEIN: ELKS/Rab6-interacting/CAST family member 1-like [Acropora millepora]